MKKSFALILSAVVLAPFTTQSQQQPGTLAGFLFGQGLAGVKLERRFENHLFVPASINNKRAALMIFVHRRAGHDHRQKQRWDIRAKRRKHHHQRRENFWQKMGALWSERGEDASRWAIA